MVGPGNLRLLSADEMQMWMDAVPWRYAASMPKHPHEYTLKERQDPDLFEMVVATIWAGYDRYYLNRKWRSLDVGHYFVWICTLPVAGAPAPIAATVLVNRAVRCQDRLL